MVRQCVIEGCTGGICGSKFRGFRFPIESHPELCRVWTTFVNKDDWKPAKSSLLCYEHFDTNMIMRNKERWKLRWELSPIPTLNPPSSFKRALKRKASSTASYATSVEYVKFDNLQSSHAPPGFHFNRESDHVIYYNLVFDCNTGFPSIFEAIKVDKDLHVQLQYKGQHVPLPGWFRYDSHAKLRSYEQLRELQIAILNKASQNKNILLDEMNERVQFKPKGRPPYSADMIRYALLLRYTSLQAYKLLLDKFPFPSISLLNRIKKGGVDSIKAIRKLREDGKISSHIVLMVDEMFLQKGTQYQAGDYVGCDENNDLYKGVAIFMIVGLQKSIPFVVQALPEVHISGKWLADKIDNCIGTLCETGFLVRAVCTDNHSSNVNSFKRLRKLYAGDDCSFLHPLNNQKRTYLLFDTVHIVKNIRNNLLASRKFVFPTFEFKFSYAKIHCPAGFIAWSDLHAIYECDLKLEANLKKAHKLSYSALHPGNNKQSVPLALTIFHDTTLQQSNLIYPLDTI